MTPNYSANKAIHHAIAYVLLACSLASCEKTVDSAFPKKSDTEITIQDIDLPEVEIAGTYSTPYISEYNSGPRGNTTVRDSGGSTYGIGETSLLQAGNPEILMTKAIYSGEDKATLVVLAEFDNSTEEIKKTTVVVRGSQLVAEMVQFGGGVNSYDPWSGFYRYTTYYQLESGLPSLGPLLIGTIYKITGRFNPNTKIYSMTITKVL